MAGVEGAGDITRAEHNNRFTSEQSCSSKPARSSLADEKAANVIWIGRSAGWIVASDEVRLDFESGLGAGITHGVENFGSAITDRSTSLTGQPSHCDSPIWKTEA
jgi:hypothetical protein